MKKILVFLLSIALLFSLASCAKSESPETPAEPVAVKIAVLKGATAMGLAKLLTDEGTRYEGTVYGTADEVAALLINGDIDIAALPANLASVLYNKTEGKIKVLAVNTLGVLYVVENGDSVHSIADLKGRTVYSTGKGTTPEFALNYILAQNGIDPQSDLTIEYKSESTEIAALLGGDSSDTVAVLPQPYVAAVMAKNPEIRIALDLTMEWDAVSADGGKLVTGVTVITQDAADRLGDAVIAEFMADYRTSVEYANTDIDDTAALVERLDVAPAAVAKAALPYCNIVCIEGEELKTALSAYLAVLEGFNPQSVGGKLPDEGFYYAQ